MTCLVVAAGANVRNPPLIGATNKEKLAVQRIGEGQRIAVIGEPELQELLEQAEAGMPAETDTVASVVLNKDDPAAGAVVDQPAKLKPSSGEGQEMAASARKLISAPAPAAWERPVAHPWVAAPTEPSQPQNYLHPAHPDHSIFLPKPAILSPSVPVPPPSGQQTPSQSTKPERRWVLHVVMWSVILFLTVGMLVVGMILSLVGVPEPTWAAVVGISWLIAPVVFLVWLVLTIIGVVRSRR